MVGKELVKAQDQSESRKQAREKWKFTQNWIAYEIGLACQQGTDVWVICDSVLINFPVPYLNNFDIWGIRRDLPGSLSWAKTVFEDYGRGLNYSVNGRFPERKFICPHCKVVFNFHSELPENMETPCPTCLKTMKFQKGWLLDQM